MPLVLTVDEKNSAKQSIFKGIFYWISAAGLGILLRYLTGSDQTLAKKKEKLPLGSHGFRIDVNKLARQQMRKSHHVKTQNHQTLGVANETSGHLKSFSTVSLFLRNSRKQFENEVLRIKT